MRVNFLVTIAVGRRSWVPGTRPAIQAGAAGDSAATGDSGGRGRLAALEGAAEILSGHPSVEARAPRFELHEADVLVTGAVAARVTLGLVERP